MKQVAATGLVLLLLLFLLPMLLLRGEPLVTPGGETVQESGGLPLDREVVTAPPESADAALSVTVDTGEGDPVHGGVPVAGGGRRDARLL